MPKWICPHCDAVMNVKPEHLGQTAACVSCGRKSEVKDAAAIAAILEDDPPREDLQPAAPPTLPRAETVSDTAKGVLMTTVFLMVTVGVLTMGAPGRPGIALLISAVVLVVQMILIWPFYTMADDTRTNRRLLEQMLKDNRS